MARCESRSSKKPATHARFHPAGDRVLLTLEDSPAYEYIFSPGEGLHGPPSELGDQPAMDAITTDNGSWTLVAEVGGPVRLWRRNRETSSWGRPGTETMLRKK